MKKIFALFVNILFVMLSSGQCVCVSPDTSLETEMRNTCESCYDYSKYIPEDDLLNVYLNQDENFDHCMLLDKNVIIECYEDEILEENSVRLLLKDVQRQWVYWVPAPAEPVIFPLQNGVVSDTLLLGKQCVVTDFNLHDESLHQYGVIISEDSDKTFFYDPVLERFKLLYDFTLQAGEQFVVYPTMGSISDSLVVTIDSVGSEWIDGVMLRVQYAHDQYYAQQNGQSFTYRWTFGNHTASPFKIMERVGSDYYFVPQEVAFSDLTTKGLCSYTDEDILYQPNDTMDCSKSYTYNVELQSSLECKIWPNPVTTTLSVSSEERIADVKMYDIFGKLLKEIENQDNERVDIDLSLLSGGVYLMKVTLQNGNALTRKIVKSK